MSVHFVFIANTYLPISRTNVFVETLNIVVIFFNSQQKILLIVGIITFLILQASYATALSFKEGETFLELPGAKARGNRDVFECRLYIVPQISIFYIFRAGVGLPEHWR